MKSFLKYTVWSIVIQSLLCVILVVIGNVFPALFTLTDAFLKLYNPVLKLLASHASGSGESQMVGIPLIGIPLGIVLYSIVIGFVIWLLKK